MPGKASSKKDGGEVKVRMATSDLKVGMYVCELDRPWRETPFLFQGIEVRTDEDIRLLQQYCHEVVVIQGGAETDSPGANAWREWKNPLKAPNKRSADLILEQELLKLNNHPGARSAYADRTTLEEEIQLVQKSFLEAKTITDKVLNDVRLGRSIDGDAVKHVVSELTESVLRNPDALSCYTLLKNKASYAASHALNSAVFALIFGRQLGLERQEVEILGMAGLLHDIGMVKVPDEIWVQPDKLSPIELAIVRRHVTWGVEILEQKSDMPPMVVEAARDHHERYNGKGYQLGCAGEDISKAGRIIAIVDFYDAVTSDRVYQAAITPYSALRMMYTGRGTLFDPFLIERFIQCLGIYPVGSVVELNTGEIGVVVALNREIRLRPHVVLVRRPDKTPYPMPAVVNLMARQTASGAPCEIERVLDPLAADVNPVQYLPVSAVS
jgi:putative nucleotidyltransferase with HDIG domain